MLASGIERLSVEVAAREEAAGAESASVPQSGPDAPRRRRRFLAIALRTVEPARRLALYRAVREALVWVVLLAWFVAITWSFSLFPQTTPLARRLSHGAFTVAGTLIATGLLNRIIDILIARAAGAWQLRAFGSSEDRARQLLRVPTIARAIGGFKTFVLALIALLAVLGEIGVPISSVITIGGLTAIALSLAAQSTVRDLVNGFLVLFEDQYVVGDFVTIDKYSGIVERLTLRMAQIRNAGGDLITIPHSSVTSVANESRNWSRVDFRVPVDPASDLDRAVALVRDAVEALAREEPYRQAILHPIEWIGIDDLNKEWALVRASVRTAPLRQFELRRELYARVHKAFAESGIALGAPVAESPEAP
jgi:small conductance mechanosensitive channel